MQLLLGFHKNFQFYLSNLSFVVISTERRDIYLRMKSHNYLVYITTNPARSVIYVGMTNDLQTRLIQHYENRGNPKTWAGKYYCYNLVWWERYVLVDHAIECEKEIKKWRREKKNQLIESDNPDWKFLNSEIGAWDSLNISPSSK